MMDYRRRYVIALVAPYLCSKIQIHIFMNQKKFLIEKTHILEKRSAIERRARTGTKYLRDLIVATIVRLAYANISSLTVYTKAISSGVNNSTIVLKQHLGGEKTYLMMPLRCSG